MSSMEKGRSDVKNREGAAGAEKKRRLILSDSESDGDFWVSPRSKDSAGVDGKENGSVVRKKDGVDWLRREKVKVKKKAVKSSDVVRRREEAETTKKRSIESELERKRNQDVSDEEITVKRIKTEFLKGGRIRADRIGGKKITTSLLESGDGRMKFSGERISSSKAAAHADKQSDGIREKKAHLSMSNSNKAEPGKHKHSELLGRKVFQKSVNGGVHPIGVKRDKIDTSKHDDFKVEGEHGSMRVLPRKKLSGLEKALVQRGDETCRKSSHTSAGIHCRTSSKNASASRESKVLNKLSSNAKSSRIQPNRERVSSSDKHRSRELKTGRKALSSHIISKNVDVSNVNIDSTRKTGGTFYSEVPPLGIQSTEAASGRRSTAKQRLREQIKNILLDAGWKIDLRPRRGRNYEDAVYVSPKGTGYWSITKAYAVFQDELNQCDVKEERIKHNHEAVSSSLSAVPMEALSMLKRKVVNKRRSRGELEDTQKKITGSERKRNEKEADEEVRMRKKAKLDGIVSSKVHKSTLPRRINNKIKRGCALLARGTNLEVDSECDDYIPYVWKRTVFSWMIDLGIVPANEKVKYMNKRKTRTMLEGRITRDGIQCGCCSKILTVARFELHAGSKVQQPSENIYVEGTGMSLLQCQLNAWEKQESPQRKGFYTISTNDDDPNDDTCSICGDGGDLICCDGCPSTFHLGCLGIEMLPPGDWHCAHCSCQFCGLVCDSASQGSDLTRSLLMTCSQCEEKYHQSCVLEAEMDAFGAKKNPFCSKNCIKVFRGLQKLLGVKNALEAGFSWSVIRRFDEDCSKFRCGLAQKAECNSKIAVALAVMDECFLPIVDERSGINLLHNVVYNCGSNFNRLDYSGFYTFILERADEVICAASIRIHGIRLAEMPFIGTRNMYRRQGMCRRLLDGIESALSSLNIEKLVIPAISELANTWKTVFGFQPLEFSHKQEISSINMIVFPGIGLLQKSLLKMDSAQQRPPEQVIDLQPHDMTDITAESSVPSSVVPKLDTPVKVLTCGKDAVESIEPILPADVVHSSSGVSLESSDASHVCENKFPETASNGDSVFPDVVCHGEYTVEEKYQVNPSVELESKLLCQTTLQDNPLEKFDDIAFAENKSDTDRRMIKHTSEAKCLSLDSNLFPLQDSVGSDLCAPLCSQESFSNEACPSRSEMASNCSSLPVKVEFQLSREYVSDSTQTNVKMSDDNSAYCNSTGCGPLDVIKDEFYVSPLKCDVHAVGETMHSIHQYANEEVTTSARTGLGDQNSPEVINRALSPATANKCQPSCGSSAFHDSGTTSQLPHAASGDTCEISEKSPTQEDPEMKWKQPKSIFVPNDIENLHQAQGNLDDLVHFSESKISSNGGIELNSLEANCLVASLKQDLFESDINATHDHATVKVGE